MAFDIKTFELYSGVLELHYDHRFLIWDRIGTFWTEFAALTPSSTLKQADPNKVSVKLGQNSEGLVGIEKANLTLFYPGSDLEALKALAKKFVPNLVSTLKVDLFKRVGLRLVFTRTFPTRSEAAAFVAANSTVPRLKGRHLGIEATLFEPDIRLRWEGEKNGFVARFYSSQQRLNFELPPDFRHLMPEKGKMQINQVFLDVDYYLHAETRADKIDPEEMIDSWLRVIKKEIAGVFHAV